jgi:hypothetical protein
MQKKAPLPDCPGVVRRDFPTFPSLRMAASVVGQFGVMTEVSGKQLTGLGPDRDGRNLVER